MRWIIYLLSMSDRGRFDGFELVERILDMYELWRPSIIGIEKGHIEMALARSWKKEPASAVPVKLTSKI